MAEIWLVRHGQASFGEDNYDRLSDLGRRQMELLAEHVSRVNFNPAALCSGSMERQRDSAEIFGTALELADPEIDSAFDEFAHVPIIKAHAARVSAAAETQTDWNALRNDRPAFDRFFAAATENWMNGLLTGDDIEPWPVFLARTSSGLQRIIDQRRPGQHTVVTTSAGVIAAILKSVLELPDPVTLRLSWVVLNSSVTRLVHDGSRVSLAGFNSIAHLEHVGDPDLVTAR